MYDGEITSAWDSRQDYCKFLHEIDVRANAIKMDIEMGYGKKVSNFREYFSLLKVMYRCLRAHIKKPEEQDGKVKGMKNMINYMVARNSRPYSKHVEIPVPLEDNLEAFHNMLNKLRYDKNLLVPKVEEPSHDPRDIWDGKS